ncbi:MAG: metallophosphoesterase [Candidatus Helarchaeota archaeon]|nr:metallophosphoesterase [Candidatus Helarchaeota archaeon]
MRIGLFSDTHLGCTVGDTRRNYTYQLDELRLNSIEYDFAKAFNYAVNYFVEERNELDLIIHAGDFFHFPYRGTKTILSEPSRVIGGRGIKRLNELNIPIVIIDGNHGIYNVKKISTIRQFQIFENVRIFTFWNDALSAIVNSTAMMFEQENYCIHAFPYINPISLQIMGADLHDLYKAWINQYEINHLKNSDKINICLIHGMTADATLPKELNPNRFELFIAGHNHLSKTEKNYIVPGSTEKWKFDSIDIEEKKQKRFFHFVNIEKNEAPEIESVEIPTRRMIVESVEIDLDDTHQEIYNRIHQKLEEHELIEKFDDESAARVKIILTGNIGYSTWSDLSPNLTKLSNMVLSAPNYNIIQFKVDKSIRYKNKAEKDVSEPGRAEIVYLIEDPEAEFLNFLKKLEIKKYEPKLLAQLFGNVIKKMGDIQ